MSAQVDVLAVMDAIIHAAESDAKTHRSASAGQAAVVLKETRAAVAALIAERDALRELVAADVEYDAANKAWENAPGNMEAIGDSDGRDWDGPEYQRLCRARQRRAAAIASTTGESA